MVDEILDVVDENDTIIGEASLSQCHKEGLWHRTVTIFLFNKKGEMLVQKRSPHTARPNKLCASASGHIRGGEFYTEGAKIELKEELGINAELRSLSKYSMELFYSDGTVDREHYMIFICNYDGSFDLQEEEVASLDFFSVDEIKDMLKKDKDVFTPGFREAFKHYLEHKENS